MSRRDPSYLKKLCLAIGIGVILHHPASAQCVNNLGTKTYDTVLTNTGFAIYSLNLPQFNPDSGQLVSVRFTATVNSTYGFNLKNIDASPATYDLNIGQEDQINVPNLAPYLNITPMYVGTYTLAPGQSQVSAPFPFMNNHVSTDSITGNVAPFLGNGKINVSYMSFAYTNLWAYNHANYQFGNDLNSSTQLSMQYLYCKAGVVLETDLIRWSAVLTAPRTVKLDWSVADEKAGRQYEIQRSEDGHSFITIGMLAAGSSDATADYTYTDDLPPTTTGSRYYRLQIRDNTRFSWSPVKQISVEAAGKALRIFPNPATDHIDIATGTANSDWQVDILSATGGLVQRSNFPQSNFLHIVFNTHLSAGTYFARITDLRGQKVQVSSFIVTTLD
ncbi:T9SS type A sorting domain-containing protein [Puia sp.]|jgi:hypothetical protein|uniref:T9SS type A sorting domain-containing protein n=1 Tax=Puia sp. TaxID=2045100 RepID=UPI002F3F5C1F